MDNARHSDAACDAIVGDKRGRENQRNMPIPSLLDLDTNQLQLGDVARVCRIHTASVGPGVTTLMPRFSHPDVEGTTSDMRTFVAAIVERSIEWVVNWQRSYPGARLLAEYHSSLGWIPLEIRQAVLTSHSRLVPAVVDSSIQTEAEVPGRSSDGGS